MVSVSSISGLASGVDSASIVDQLMAIEGRKITRLQDKQADELAKQREINVLGAALTSLRSVAMSLADQSNFLINQSNLTSNTSTAADSLLGVTPSSDVVPGTHTIIVTALAAAEKLSSGSAVEDSTGTVITSDTVALGYTADSFTVQGTATNAQTVNVTSTDSLRDIRDKINQLNTGADATGVTATIMKVGDSDYRLIVTAGDTGLTNGLVNMAGAALDGGGGNLKFLQLGNGSITLQAAANAEIDIDSLTITRESNSITDALSGYTLDLLNADAGTTITVTTSADQTAIKAKIQSFVDSYNGVMDFINEQMAFDTTTLSGGILAGESMLRSIQSQLSGSLLTAVPGLASDRNSLALIGVEPDKAGHLSINATTLDSLLATDVNTLRDIFAANGIGSSSDLEFLDYGLGTVSGTYAVNITAAAEKANVTGTTDLSGDLVGANTVTITDGDSRQAIVSLTDSQTLSSIVSALNTDFETIYTEQRQMATALVTDSGTPATSATLLESLTDGAFGSLNIVAGDTISITGTNRTGASVSYTFTVSNPATDTVGDLLASIQAAFDQKVSATLDGSGNVTITDYQEGDSSLTFSLAANNEGGGSLNFGAETVAQEGRYAMQVSAVASGNFLQLVSSAYGSSSSFSIAQTASNLGITDDTYTGKDVAGTIGGEAATGAGQALSASSGDVDGVLLMYTGTATGAIGTMAVNLGIGPQLDNLLETYTNPISGLVQLSIDSYSSIYDSLQTQIDSLAEQLDMERERLTASFLAMEQIMSQTNATGAWLSQQISTFTSNK